MLFVFLLLLFVVPALSENEELGTCGDGPTLSVCSLLDNIPSRPLSGSTADFESAARDALTEFYRDYTTPSDSEISCLQSVLAWLRDILDSPDDSSSSLVRSVVLTPFPSDPASDATLFSLLSQLLVSEVSLIESFQSAPEVNSPISPSRRNLTYVLLDLLSYVVAFDIPPLDSFSEPFVSTVTSLLDLERTPLTFLESFAATQFISSVVLSLPSSTSDPFPFLSSDVVELMLSIYQNSTDIVYRAFTQHRSKRIEYHFPILFGDEDYETDEKTEYELQSFGFEFGRMWRIESVKYFHGWIGWINSLGESESEIEGKEKEKEKEFVLESIFSLSEWKEGVLNDGGDQLVWPLLFYAASDFQGRQWLVSSEFALTLIGRLFLVGFYEKDVPAVIFKILESEEEEEVFSSAVELLEKEFVLSYMLNDVGPYLAPSSSPSNPPIVTGKRVNEVLRDLLLKRRDLIPMKYRKRLLNEIVDFRDLEIDYSSVSEENEKNRFAWVTRRIEKRNLSTVEIISTIKKELIRTHTPVVLGLCYDVLYDAFKELSRKERSAEKRAKLLRSMLHYSSKGLKLNRDLLGLRFKRAKLMQSARKDSTFYLMELVFLQNRLKSIFQEEPDYEKIQEDFKTMVHPRMLLRRSNTHIHAERLRRQELRMYLKYGPPRQGHEVKFEEIELPKTLRFVGKTEKGVFGSEVKR